MRRNVTHALCFVILTVCYGGCSAPDETDQPTTDIVEVEFSYHITMWYTGNEEPVILSDHLEDIHTVTHILQDGIGYDISIYDLPHFFTISWNDPVNVEITVNYQARIVYERDEEGREETYFESETVSMMCDDEEETSSLSCTQVQHGDNSSSADGVRQIEFLLPPIEMSDEQLRRSLEDFFMITQGAA